MAHQDAERQLGELRQRARSLEARIVACRGSGEDPAGLIAERRQVSAEQEALRALLAKAPAAPPAPAVAGPSGALRVELVTGDEQFAALRGEWNDLLPRARAASVFSTWEWLYPWWQTYGEGKHLRLVAVRDGDGVLVGLAPLMLGKRRRGKRPLAPRRLAFIGTGEGPLADGLTILAAGARRQETIAAIWQCCREMSADWDLVELEDLSPTDEAVLTLQQCALREEYLALSETLRLGVCGDLPGSYEDYVASVRHQSRRNYLRSLPRRLQSEFASVEYRRLDQDGDLGEALRELARLSIHRFRGRGERSAWEEAAFGRCVAAAAGYLAEQRRLRIDALVLDGRTAAMVLGFAMGDTYQCFQPTFDTTLEALRPLHCLLGRCIAERIGEGLRRFDFLAGEHAYKTEYFDSRKPLGRLLIGREEPDALGLLGRELLRKALRAKVKGLLQHRPRPGAGGGH